MSIEGQENAVHQYESAWNELDIHVRGAALEAAWSDDGLYIDDEVPGGLRGRDALSDYISLEHAQTPGLVVTTSRTLVILADRGWLQWEARADSGATSSGTDFIEFAADDRIARLTDFLD